MREPRETPSLETGCGIDCLDTLMFAAANNASRLLVAFSFSFFFPLVLLTKKILAPCLFLSAAGFG